MKIAILSPVFPPYHGGIGQAACQEAEELSRRGHDVTVLVPLYKGSDLEFEKEAKDYKIKRLRPILKFGNAAWIRNLDLSGFDVVHLHYPFIGVINAVVGQLAMSPKPLAVTYHMDLIGRGWKKLFFKIYNFLTLPKSIKQADKIIVSSLDYARHGLLASYLAQEPQKFVEAPFSPYGGSPAGRGAESRSQSEKTVLFVGGLDKAHYFKGVDVLLKSVKELISNIQYPIRVLIVGEGNLRPYYENLARKWGIEKQVNFLGKLNREELNQVYSTADVFVLPSVDSSEAYGLVVLEAMASGLPVVASDLPGVRANINSERGRLVKPGDAIALAQSLKEILSDDARRKKMGESAREWVMANRTLSGEIDKLEKVLVDAVSCKL